MNINEFLNDRKKALTKAVMDDDWKPFRKYCKKYCIPVRADCIGCGYVQIVCPECGANISITIIRNQEDISKESAELIKRWNKRT